MEGSDWKFLAAVVVLLVAAFIVGLVVRFHGN